MPSMHYITFDVLTTGAASEPYPNVCLSNMKGSLQSTPNASRKNGRQNYQKMKELQVVSKTRLVPGTAAPHTEISLDSLWYWSGRVRHYTLIHHRLDLILAQEGIAPHTDVSLDPTWYWWGRLQHYTVYTHSTCVVTRYWLRNGYHRTPGYHYKATTFGDNTYGCYSDKL